MKKQYQLRLVPQKEVSEEPKALDPEHEARKKRRLAAAIRRQTRKGQSLPEGGKV